MARRRRGAPVRIGPALLPAGCLLLMLDAASAFTRRANPDDPYAKVGALIPSESHAAEDVAPANARQSKRFLVATFPSLRQVGYCHLPDNVWRPLVVGDVAHPRGVAVDRQSARLFVADPPNRVIWWYQLTVTPTGLLVTTGKQKAAVEGVIADGLTVNGVGDLYFTGRMAASTSNHSSVFRQDAASILSGRTMAPTEIYTRSNTGTPNPKVWVPSGIAVDALFVYWGNREGGTKHGSVVKGSRMNVGLLSQDRQLKALSTSVDDVRGMTATGTHVFYVSPSGVRGVLKSAATPADDPVLGLIAAAPPEQHAATRPGRPPAPPLKPWNPTGITWDGDNTVYFTDTANGAVYSLPALNVLPHNLTKYSDAPGIHGLAVVGFAAGATDSSGAAPAGIRASSLLAALLALAGVGRISG